MLHTHKHISNKQKTNLKYCYFVDGYCKYYFKVVIVKVKANKMQ